MRMFRFLAAAAAVGGIATPLAAQTAYPYAQAYPPQYQQQYPQQGYPQQGYGYQQGYAQNPVEQIIDQLLGNRYNVTDRSAVSRCASAAMAQAAAEYRGNGYNQGYGQPGYGQQGHGYNHAAAMRVTSITDVQRRNNGLRVSGLMSSGYGGQYGSQYGNQNRGYGDVSFRCNVDYRGAVTNVRIGRNKGYRG